MAKKKSTFWADFKAFAMRGNILDMAVGVVVGGAFGKIVTSLVNDIIMPLVGWLIGGVDFTQLKIELKGTLASNTIQAVSNVAESVGAGSLTEAVDSLATAAPEGDVAIASVSEMAQQTVSLNYGMFIQQFIDFLIIALCIFLVLRLITLSSRKKAEKAAAEAAEAAAKAAQEPAPKSEDVVLLEEIRDLLKNQK